MKQIQRNIALSSRILAMMGLVEETRGHVSARSPENNGMYIRSRTKTESGLLFTEPDAIQFVDFNGNNDQLGGNYIIPNEHPIHGEIYKNRPEVGCVIHAHPPSCVVCTIAGIPLRPIIGAYDPQAMKLTINGVPVFKDSKTLTNIEIVNSMLEVMGNHNVCLLQGHGIVVTGKTVEEATMRAIKLEHLAKLTLEATRSGNELTEISKEDIEYFQGMFEKNKKKKGSSNTHGTWIWSHYVKLLELKGLGLT